VGGWARRIVQETQIICGVEEATEARDRINNWGRGGNSYAELHGESKEH